MPLCPCQGHINIEALCAVPPEALAHSPSQMPLSCPVGLISQHERELHKDGGGGGVVRRARAARAPKAKPCATSCGKSSAASCAASFTCPSFMCRPRAVRGAVCVCWAWVPPLEDDACRNEHLHASVFRGAQHALRHVKAALAADRTLSGVGLASGSPRAAAYLFSLPPGMLRWGGRSRV